MAVISRPFVAGPRRLFEPLGRLARATAGLAQTLRASWAHAVQAGQLGPVDEVVIGRHTGART